MLILSFSLDWFVCWLVLVVAFGLGFGFADLVFDYWRFGLNSVWVYGAWFAVICCFRYVGVVLVV